MEQIQDRSEFLASEPIGRLLLRLAVPAVIAQLVNVLYNIIDRVYIGHIPGIGKLALTGVGVCLPIILVISAFAALVAMGGAPQASIQMGKRNNEKAEEILGNCTALMLLFSVVLMAVIFIWCRPLLLMFGASENTIQYAEPYMRIYTWGTPFVQLALGLNAFISAQGFTRASMNSVIIGAVANIILDPIFIFLLEMGPQGAALATVISQAISALWMVRFLTSEHTVLHIRRQYLRIDWSIIAPCLALGLSPFIMQVTESAISVCFNSSLLRYGGDTAVGAMTILNSLMMFSMMPLRGLTQGAQPITSYNYGAKNAARVKASFSVLLKACLGYSLLFGISILAFPELFAKMFTPDPELIAYTAWAGRIYFAATAIFGIQLACQQTLVSIGNAKTSTFLALFRKVLVLIPLIYILPAFFQDKAMAVYLAEPVADFLAVSLTSILFARNFKRALNEMAPRS